MAAKKPADIEREIRENMKTDTALADTSNVVVTTSMGGSIFKKKVKVSLSGSVPNKTQKEKLERWVENKYGDQIVFETTLTVG